MAGGTERQYMKGVSAFLQISGEDFFDVEGILSQLPSSYPDFIPLLKKKKEIRILSVGSGNWDWGQPLYFARKLKEIGVLAVVDFVEPKLERRRKLLESFEGEDSDHFGRVYSKTIDDVECNCEYDVVTVLHTLYESSRNKDGTIPTLKKITSCLKKDGLCIFILEDSAGDFQKIKRSLYPSFGKIEPVSQEVLERSLKKEKIPYEVGKMIEFDFNLDKWRGASDEELGEIMGFLFSDSLDCPPLTPQECRTVGKWVRKNTRKNGKNEYLWTPDIVIWARKNNGKK